MLIWLDIKIVHFINYNRIYFRRDPAIIMDPLITWKEWWFFLMGTKSWSNSCLKRKRWWCFGSGPSILPFNSSSQQLPLPPSLSPPTHIHKYTHRGLQFVVLAVFRRPASDCTCGACKISQNSGKVLLFPFLGSIHCCHVTNRWHISHTSRAYAL